MKTGPTPGLVEHIFSITNYIYIYVYTLFNLRAKLVLDKRKKQDNVRFEAPWRRRLP